MKTFDEELDKVILQLMGCSEGDEDIYREDYTYTDAKQALKEAIDKHIIPAELQTPEEEFRSPNQGVYDGGFNNAIKMARLALWGKEGEENE